MGVLLGPNPVRPLPADRPRQAGHVDPVRASLSGPLADRPTRRPRQLPRHRGHLVVQEVRPHLALPVHDRGSPGDGEVRDGVCGVSWRDHEAPPAMSRSASPWDARCMVMVDSAACWRMSAMICAWLR